jgi:hypothetical protein
MEDPETGGVCLWGAINVVVLGEPVSWDSKTHEMVGALPEFKDALKAINWNNAKERTQEEVVAMLRRAGSQI